MSAIEVNGVTKVYRLYSSSRDRLKELFNLGGKKYHHEFDALRDISFIVDTGETVGIIGQNGSGKSTLLKIITGVIQPTGGTVRVNGRVSSLLELGAGFNLEFTGRDNVFMNGALMGFSRKEIERKVIDIEAFADIGEFIDQPVRTYSSGMYTRLAFSVAINVEPDILIIDEILSVGDENFQSKCRKKIQELRENGITILLVSHDMFTIENLCTKVFLFDHGRCLAEGTPKEVIQVYHNLLKTRSGTSHGVLDRDVNSLPCSSQRPQIFKQWGTKDVEITGVTFLNDQGAPVDHIKVIPNGRLSIRIDFVAHKKVNNPVFGFSIQRDDGADVNRSNTRMSHFEIPFVEGKGTIAYCVDVLPLLPGKFFLTVGICDYDMFIPYSFWDKSLYFEVEKVGLGEEQFGILPLAGKWYLLGKKEAIRK
jgi:ABC-type polysaccharide/polyol phosphate transport system ATPase subunit